MDDDFIPILIFTTIGGFVLYAIIGALVRAPGALQQHKFQNLGNLRGRTLNSIIAEVGPPNSRSAAAGGRILCQWIAPGHHIALIFTGDICDGISHEYAASTNYIPASTPAAGLRETPTKPVPIPDTEEVASADAKCNCQHCNGHIAFPAEMAGQMFECPHCNRDTKLIIPPAELNQTVTCPCQHCGEQIEFESGDLVEENRLVLCPSCGFETKLFIPKTFTNELRKLVEYRNQGLFSQAEFEAAKKKLLA
jgi:rRNA maturation protein Nop10